MNDDKTTQTTKTEVDATTTEKEDKAQELNFKNLRDKLKQEKDEKAQLQAKLEEYQKAESERKQKELEKQGEYDKAKEEQQKEAKRREAKLLDEKVNAQLETELIKAGADPKMAELLVEKAKNQVHFDEAGKFTNMSTVVEGLKADYKDAFSSKKKGTPHAAPNPDKKKLDLSPKGINEMSYQDYIQQVTQNN